MKKIVRKNTFETNSSSSHSLVIGKRTQPVLEHFPRNSEYIYHLEQQGVADGDEVYVEVQRLQSEVDKAKFMLNVIAAHMDVAENLYPDVSYYAVDKLKSRSDFKSQRDYWYYLDSLPRNKNRTFEVMIKQNPFVWFKELLEEETGTEFKFEAPESEYFPYYSAASTEDDNLDDIAGIDWWNEEKFKARVKEIVFDEEIVILDADMPYGSEVDLTL